MVEAVLQRTTEHRESLRQEELERAGTFFARLRELAEEIAGLSPVVDEHWFEFSDKIQDQLIKYSSDLEADQQGRFDPYARLLDLDPDLDGTLRRVYEADARSYRQAVTRFRASVVRALDEELRRRELTEALTQADASSLVIIEQGRRELEAGIGSTITREELLERS